VRCSVTATWFLTPIFFDVTASTPRAPDIFSFPPHATFNANLFRAGKWPTSNDGIVENQGVARYPGSRAIKSCVISRDFAVACDQVNTVSLRRHARIARAERCQLNWQGEKI